MITSAGCAARSPAPARVAEAPSYRLVVPPDVPDTHYPGGIHIRVGAPYEHWHQVALFPTLEECESTRVHRIDESIDSARAEVGEQAKFQLPVRRAVNARCIPNGPVRNDEPTKSPRVYPPDLSA